MSFMLRACVVVVLFLSLTATPLSAACEAPRVYDLGFREIALDLAFDGDDLWVASAHGLSLWSPAAPAPVRAGSVSVPGSTTSVVAVGEGAWAASGTALYFVERSPMRIAATLDLGSVINDLAEHGGFLYAATLRGVVQVDALDPRQPVEARTLSTGGALALALAGSTLYAAGGDRSFDAFALTIPTLPQKIGTIETAGRTTSIRAAGSWLVASDGQSSEVFSGPGALLTSAAQIPFGGTSATALGGSVLVLGGSGREIRAVDALASPPLVLASLETPITEGSVNRVAALEIAEGSLFAAGGDAGLLVWDVASLRAPFPVRSVRAGGVGSGWISGDRLVVAPETGGLRRWTDAGGQLVAGAQWEQASVWTIHDGEDLRVIASSGATLAWFDASSSTPEALGSIALRADVRSAIRTESGGAVAVLADGSVWRVDPSTPAAAEQLAVPGAPQFIARGASAVATGEVRGDGTTVIRYWANAADFPSAAPRETTLQGASNGGIAVAEDVVVAATFEGLVLADFGATDGIRVVPGTNFAPARDLHVEGDRIFVATPNRVDVRELGDGTLIRSLTPGGDARAVHASGSTMLVSTSSGFDLVDLDTGSELPSFVPVPQPVSRHYASMESDGELVWIATRDAVDVFRVSAFGTPALLRTIPRPPTTVGLAAIGESLHFATVGGTVTGTDSSGRQLATLEIDESPDQEVIGLHAVGGALWLSLRVGCLTTGCAGRTVVLDPRSGSLVRTASLDGTATDVAVSGGRAAAIFTLPGELRTYSIADPAHPSPAASRAAEGNPVSVDLAEGIAWTLGDRLRSWFEDSLAPRSVALEPYAADPAGRVTYLDQEVHALGSCLVVVGREPQPSRWEILGSTLVPAAPIDASGAMRDLAPTGSGFILLGETSLEAWSSVSSPDPSRRRLVRR